MAVQKSKTSKQRTNTRYAQWKLETPNLSECPQCHELKASHRVCPKCGRPTRVGHVVENGKKMRVCKKADCGAKFE